MNATTVLEKIKEQANSTIEIVGLAEILHVDQEKLSSFLRVLEMYDKIEIIDKGHIKLKD